MVLVQKWPFFQLFFLANIGQENVFYDILERKNAFLGYKNKKFKKSKNWHFSKGVNPLFWSKNGHFPNIFLGDRGHENVFYEFVERKNAFLGYKNKKFKIRKIDIFPKGLTHGFFPKWLFCQLLFFRTCRPGKCVLRDSRTKKRLSRLSKTTSSKNRKIDIFPRRLTYGFGPKMGIFPTFIF